MTFRLGLALCVCSPWIASAAQWNEPEIVGYLDAQVLPEASGLAASALHPDRLYHINDSGNEAAFVLSTKHGGAMQTVRLQGVSTRDTEDLSVGRCPDQGSCLYIADTGDNDRARSELAIFVVRERDSYPASIPVDFVLRLKYPDGPHNVEGFAVHPSGEAFLITKEEPARFFQMTIPQIQEGASAELDLKVSGSLRLRDYLPGARLKDALPTGLAIRADGQEIAVLCKAGALALDWNLASDDAARSVVVLPFLPVPQAEAITYSGNELLYTTESNKSLKGQVPLIFVGQK